MLLKLGVFLFCMQSAHRKLRLSDEFVDYGNIILKIIVCRVSVIKIFKIILKKIVRDLLVVLQVRNDKCNSLHIFRCSKLQQAIQAIQELQINQVHQIINQ